VFFGGEVFVEMVSWVDKPFPMKILLKAWELTFFTQPLSVIVVLITFLIIIKENTKYESLNFLKFYLGSYLTLAIIDIGNTIIHNFYSYHVLFWAEVVVTAIEILTFTYFMFSIMHYGAFKRFIKISLPIVFAVLVILVTSGKGHSFSKLNNIYLTESVALIIYTALAFIDFFKHKDISKTLGFSDFWIASGLAIYLLTTFPINIIGNYLLKMNSNLYTNLYSIVYISYIFMFMLFIKGYRYKKRELGYKVVSKNESKSH